MSRNRLQDQTLFCEQCGISFIWSVHEQTQTAAHDTAKADTPRLCPGCRWLLPAADRERGLVRWYSARKRYGFIVRADGSDLFFHAAEILDPQRLQPGDLVEFNVKPGHRGPSAHAIDRLALGSDLT